MKKERKKRRAWKQSLKRGFAGMGAFLIAALPILDPLVVQAAESVAEIHADTNEDLWKSNTSWTKISDNIWQLDASRIETTGNLKVKTKGYLNDTGNGTQVLDYVEADGILSPGDGSTLTLYYDREAAGGIGQINGRTVGMKVVFSEIEGLECNGETVDGLGHCPVVEHFADLGVQMHKSGIIINENFWKGYTQHGIYSMKETYTLYYVDTGEVISQKGAHMTANSLNEGEGIQYYTQEAEVGNLMTTLRSDHNLSNEGYGDWIGRNNDFVDLNHDPSFTKNSVSFELCTDEPSFRMYSGSGDYWHTYTVAPLVASIPDDPQKVGVTGDGLDVDQFEDVAMGQELTFEVRQKVQHLGITGSLAYKQFALIDQLPEELTYQSAGVYYTMPDGTQQWLGEDAVQITESNGLVRAELTADYLNGGEGKMPYAMEVYTLQVKATVNEKAALKDQFLNEGWSVVNHKDQEHETVPVTPIDPALSIDKSVEKDTVNVQDEDTYTLVATQTVNGGMAKNVYLKDVLKQEGVKYVKDSFQVLGKDGKDITKNCVITVAKDNRSVTIQTKQNLLYNEKIQVKYRVLFEDPKLAGQTVHNTATTGADNTPEVTDDEDVKVLKPELSITKESPKYEYKVGDKVEYTVKVTQTVDGAIARNVKVSDLSLPDGLKVKDAKASGVADVKLTKEGTGWKVSAPNLKKGETITVTFDCIAEESVNAKETVNTAKASADNSDPKEDQEEVYVNSAELAIDKKVSKEEWKVGDTVDYTVSVSNTKDASIANNVVISDITLPEGLTLTGETKLTGVPATVNRPIRNDKKVHGEVKEEAVTSSISKDEKSNSWIAKISALPSGVTAKVTFQCTVTEAINGMEIINTAHAKADNAGDVKDDAKIWINSPGLEINKIADNKKAKVGEVVTYTLVVRNNQAGTVARNVVIDDTVDKASEPYVKLQKNSIVLLDSNGNKIEDAKISVKGNYFKIETGKNLVNPENNYQIWDLENSKKPLDGGKWNSLGLESETLLTVEYQVKIVSENAAGAEIHNVATANSDENIPVEDEETVIVNGPHLDVEKTSDKKAYTVDEIAEYEITVRQTREGYTAKDVVVKDEFDRGDLAILADSIKVQVNKKDITPKSVTLNERNNGYVIETGVDLSDTDKMVITYQVKFKEAALEADKDEAFVNTVVAKGSNTNPSEDDNKVIVTKKDAALDLRKQSDKTEYQVGEIGEYTLKVYQLIDGATAKQVVVRDAFVEEGMTIIPDSIKVLMNGKEIPPEAVQLNEIGNGYDIETGLDLTAQDELLICYQVKFEKAFSEGVTNKAKAESENTNPAEDDNTVKVMESEPDLSVEKASDKSEYQVGETGKYEIVVKQTVPYAIAKEIVVKDIFDKEGMVIDEKSVKVFLNDKELEVKSLKLNDQKNGYEIETGTDLTDQDVLKVTYDVKFEKAVEGNKTTNVVKVKGSNTPEREDKVTVAVGTPSAETPSTPKGTPGNPPKTGDRVVLGGIILALLTSLGAVGFVIYKKRKNAA